MSTTIESRSAVPWWAAFGAPLVGVPLLVGLLALGSTTDANGKTGGAVEEADVEYVTEYTGALQATAGPAPHAEGTVDSRC